MNDTQLDRIAQYQIDKYYIYSKDEDWINKGIENQVYKVYHFILEINLRYMKKIDNKDIFDCNIVLEQNDKKDIFRFKLAFNRIENLVGIFDTHDLYKETKFIDKVRGIINKKHKFSIIDLIDIIFDKKPKFQKTF